MTHQQNKDAMDLYHDWAKDYAHITGYYEYVKLHEQAERSINLMVEMVDGGRENSRHVAGYMLDINKAMESKLKIFLN